MKTTVTVISDKRASVVRPVNRNPQARQRNGKRRCLIPTFRLSLAKDVNGTNAKHTASRGPPDVHDFVVEVQSTNQAESHL